MHELFPELRHATNILFADISKKGSIRRFRRTNTVPEQLDRPMWAHTFLSDRIHQHVREVADVSLRLVPQLAMKFIASDKKYNELAQAATRRRRIILASRNISPNHWPDYRVQLMRTLLAGEVTVQFTPVVASQARNTQLPILKGSLRRYTIGAPMPSSQTGKDAYKLRAVNFIKSKTKRASVSGSFSRLDDDRSSMSFSSFHSATERDNDLDDENVEMSLESRNVII
jgi:hypothetical protein